ncbi:hypothetical protein BU23DRAFT_7030 [Bimuria novae-zelandiae CBS 107.79]|uniref:Uncharacterized protein n=1 Tax=Bimuria novae-zelandiae CBS 107.79 TaxID=1447943 RepID=A0A6A5VTX6_9PLEO|nr:hypothetical protein BU23DRAFT_7030 [Bimuria novae-zelandiae CBS 107.79]
MAFFKQLLQVNDKPPDPQQAHKQERAAAQNLSTGARGSHITLSRIRQALVDLEEDDDPYNPGIEHPLTYDPGPPPFDIAPNASSAEEILQATRKYLDAEIMKEQDQVDWKPEYKFEKVVLHPKGNELPLFSSRKEFSNVSHAGDLTIPVKKLGMAVDRAVLKRIQAGLGPRPSKIDDLIERLRLEPKTHSELDEPPDVEETYAELLAVLQAWNMRVGKASDSAHGRKGLVDALEARCQVIHETETHDQDDILLEGQCGHLRQALHTFRPELKYFQNQDVFDQLVIMLANQGTRTPGVDDELKDAIIKTLFREYRCRLYFSEEHTARRIRLDAEIARARLQGDSTEEGDLVKERRMLDKESCNQASEQVRSVIRSAQKALYGNMLEALQLLTEQQAGQKWAACEMTKAPASVLAQSCIDNANEMGNMLQDWDLNVEDTVKAAIRELQRMHRLDADNRRQAKKLAGLDVSRAERKAVMARRRKDYRTPLIMKEVQDQSSQVQVLSRRVLERMESLESSLNCVLEVAGNSYRAHDTLMSRMDEDDPYCTAQAACEYTVKGSDDAKVQVEGATVAKETATGIVDEQNGW